MTPSLSIFVLYLGLNTYYNLVKHSLRRVLMYGFYLTMTSKPSIVQQEI